MLRGAIRRDSGDVRAALKDLLAAESIARALGDELLGADVRIELGRTMLLAAELAAAREHFERAATVFASLGARPREAHALAWLAVSSAAHVAKARVLLQRAVALSASDLASRAPYLVLLGRACAEAGDGAGAKRALDDVLAAAPSDRDARIDAEARMLLGLVLHDGGDLARAAEHLASARDVFALSGLDGDAAIARGHLGVLAREEGRVAEAYALLADARDITMRAGRGDAAAYFEAHLDAIAPRAPGGPAVTRDAGAPSARDLVGAWPIGSADVGSSGVPALHTRIVARIVRAGLEEAPTLPDDALVVGTDGSWFRAPGTARIGLERRRSLALLLDRLATERIAHAGATLGSASLFAAAWPGEKAIASAAAHRVRVAVATLRKMGLRDAITTLPDGYALSPELRVVRA
jgi:tetratricopeptide (TPR) repeat protein